MSAVEPLFSHHAATDVLKNLFSPAQSHDAHSATKGVQADTTPEASATAATSASVASNKSHVISGPGGEPASTPDTSSESTDEQDVPQAEAKEISAEANENVQIDHFITQTQQSDDSEQVTKADLMRVLETFMNVMKETTAKNDGSAHQNLPSTLNFEPQVAESMVEIIESKNSEIDELKNLLVEAQTTIIALLTDRVDDKAKIATFESQMRYLPDYERLHTQPVSSTDSDELRADLTKVKAELLSIKNNAFKTSLDKQAKWPGFKAWLSKFVAPTNA